MTYLEAAITVLRASRHPLTTKEIMERMARGGLVPLTGQTPMVTLSAALYRNLGKDPRLRWKGVPGPLRAARGTVRWTLAR
jgi:HB1, ASXL, restriction endonuclease HTH domain